MAGDTFGITSANRLVSFNRSSPSTGIAMSITGLRAGEMLVGMDLRPGGTPAGQLVAVGNNGGVYTIDPSSGAATLKSTMTAAPGDPFNGLVGTRVSVDFNTVVDQLRVVSNTGQNLRVMVDSGTTFTDTPMTIGGIPSVGVTEVTYTNNFAATCRVTAYYLDTTGDRLLTTVSASGGILTVVGGLQVDATAFSGFDISTGPDGSNIAYAALTVSGVTSLYTINLMTGAATMVGGISQLNSGESVIGLATPTPSTTPMQPVGELLALTESNKLVSFNSGFPQKLCTNAPINGVQGGDTLLSLDLRPADGNVYALANSGRLYTVNPATGTVALNATLRAAATPSTGGPFTGLMGNNFTVDVSPVADALRVLSDTGQNLAVLFGTGDTLMTTSLNPVQGLTPATFSVTANAYTNSFTGAGTSTLYVIDSANDRLLIQGRNSGSPNNGDLINVGPLNVGDVQPLIGFDINSSNNTALAALTVGTATSASLYRINLSSGQATMMNPIGVNERIRGLTYSAAPRQATAFAVTTDNRLLAFNPATPGTLTMNSALTGMQSGEKSVGFDFRPANGILYLLTDGGRIYTVNTSTAQATLLVSSLTPNAGVLPPMGSFGVDFSPVADALRVISDSEQNLAIVVDTGQTITATPLMRAMADSALPSPDVVAIAYNANYATPASTILYDIDMGSNMLLTQVPANNGVITAIGPLDPTTTFQKIGEFDIVGGDDGLALAALVPVGQTQSILYRVNLKTGALTAVGPIGQAGTSLVIGLALKLN